MAKLILPPMTTTLSQTQADLPRLVELANQGEDVVITVGGTPKARLTRVDGPSVNGSRTPVDMSAWLDELNELRRKYSTGKPGPIVEQILEEDRADR
ncbi:MAG: type II toxin-antitoxin system prevent-host-death family antitoxin, partial [Dehalococcoidia bacterium]|nr:type II toxin-antitoxin system prevent-host-death family antitoxin [Dehalococcoidia bacterium]